MSELKEEQKSVERVYVRRHSPSWFGPILLISIGVYFLLQNLGLVSELNWVAALQLWPLLLIFAGINIIVRQAPRPFGSFLSLIVALLTVAIFGYVLFSDSETVFSRFGFQPATSTVQREPVAYAADVTQASVTIDFGAPGADLYALNDSSNLIEGEVSYGNELIFETDASGDRATIRLGTQDSGGFFLNPATWFTWGDLTRWDLGLSPDVEMDLRLDVGSGSVDLDLSELQLTNLEVDGGSGSMTVVMPAGNYDAGYDFGSGSINLTLPAAGRHEIDLNSGSGAVTIYLPAAMEARIELDSGSGSFSADSRLDQTSDSDVQVWETDGYGDNANQVTLFIEQGSGSVRIQEP